MASTPVELFTGDGVEDDFNYVFEVPGNYSAVLVKTRPVVEESFSTLTLNVEYTHTPATKLIHFNAGFIPATDTIIRIERFTNRDRQVDYVGGSTIEERNLDNDPNRLTMVTQEIEAGLLDALRRNDERDAWNGEGLPSENCADAVEADGWVTLQQLEQAVGGGGLPTSVSEGLVFTFTGNGTETLYALDDVEGIHKELLNVFVESVYQSADGSVYDVLRKSSSGYPSSGDDSDYVEFVTAPPDGADIEIRTLKGSFFSEIPDFSVTTVKLADDAVTLPKMNMGAGLSDRFVVINELGDPVARRIGGADFSALTADENATLAGDFSTLIKTLRLDQFANPNFKLDLNNKRIEQLGAGTPATTDGCNVQQMETHVTDELLALAGVSLKLEKGSLNKTTWRNMVIGSSPMIIEISQGFRPDAVWIMSNGGQLFLFGSSGTAQAHTWFFLLPENDNVYMASVPGAIALQAGFTVLANLGMKTDGGNNFSILNRNTDDSPQIQSGALPIDQSELYYLAIKL